MERNLSLRLSYWAKHHRVTAAGLLILCKVIVGAIGFYSGIAMALGGYTFPAPVVPGLLVGTALYLLWAYPSKRQKQRLGRMAFYRKQKTADAALALFGFAFWMYVGNAAPTWVTPTLPTSTATVSAHATALAIIERFNVAKDKLAEKHQMHPAEKKHLGARMKEWIGKRALKSAQSVSKWKRAFGGMPLYAKILLTALVIGLFVAGAYGVFALSCSLACSGMDALAVVVGVGGAALLIAGATWTLLEIWRKRKPSS